MAHTITLNHAFHDNPVFYWLSHSLSTSQLALLIAPAHREYGQPGGGCFSPPRLTHGVRGPFYESAPWRLFHLSSLLPMKVRSQRIADLVQSPIRAMTDACLARQGVNLGQGICDLPAPPEIKDAACAAITHDQNTYARFDGTDLLRKEIARKLRRYNGVSYNEQSEIVVTVGASGALTATLHALTDPGDEIIVFEPSYGYHLIACQIAGVHVRPITLRAPDFPLDLDRIEAAITPRTRAILINTPANPSGKVYNPSELTAIAALCIHHDIVCITDEIYEYIVYDGRKHVSMASIEGMRERTITISGFSKTFSITGWRIGYVAAPAPFALAIGLMSDMFNICAPTPLQNGVAGALSHLPMAYYDNLATHYQHIRDQFCDVLDEVGLPAIRPQGAYYVLCDIRSLRASSAQEGAMQLLDEAGVAGVPGSAFFEGTDGDGLLRFCYAKQPSAIDEACERLRNWGRTRR